jgi:copper chaperone CopZ
MTVVHINTFGMYCDQCPHRIEGAVEELSGVKDARCFRTLCLTSVLYDPALVDAGTILKSITDAGFPARLAGAAKSD